MRRFVHLVLAALALASLAGCGGSGGVVAPAGPGSGDDVNDIALWHVNAVISDNHGHKATINAAQLENGRALTVPLHGNPTHAHHVDLSVEELTRIRDMQRVTKTSSTDLDHRHFVSFEIAEVI